LPLGKTIPPLLTLRGAIKGRDTTPNPNMKGNEKGIKKK